MSNKVDKLMLVIVFLDRYYPAHDLLDNSLGAFELTSSGLLAADEFIK